MNGPSRRWEIKEVPAQHDAIAKDGSHVRQLLATAEASVVHCTLPSGVTSVATRNVGIDEIWYFLEGQGHFWLGEKDADAVEEVRIGPNTCLTIPEGVRFQFRTIGEIPLTFICVTTPPWPGEHSNVEVEDLTGSLPESCAQA
jgi:mannose-6-phosphate isomerase-like protein (cupin superfamily)